MEAIVVVKSLVLDICSKICNPISKRLDKLFTNRKGILNIVRTALESIETISNLSKGLECQKKSNILNKYYKQLDEGIGTIIKESWSGLPIFPKKRKYLKDISDRIHVIRDGILCDMVVKGSEDEDINQQTYYRENPEAEVKYNRQYMQKIVTQIEAYKPHLHEILKVLHAKYLIK